MATLLQQMTEAKTARAERLRLAVREELRAAVHELLPGVAIVVFGSLSKAGRYTEYSNVDIALESEPPQMSVYQLIAQLSAWLGRRVDVTLLNESRLRDKILREGERWTPQA